MDKPIKIESHAPERRHKSATTLHNGCCCCCCCCLHTIGSIVGAAIAPRIGRGSPMAPTHSYDELTGEEVPLTKKPDLSAVTVFWCITCFLVFLVFLSYGILAGWALEPALFIGILVLLFFPLGQLAAVLLTMLVFAIWPRDDKKHQFTQLGKITLGIFAGTGLGILAMVHIGVVLMLVS